MTDPDLVAKKLSLIETCVAELRRLAHPEALGHDVVQERFITHTLQIAIQAALDVASHIVTDERLGEPRNRAALFESLHRGGWIEGQMADVLRQMIGFRNVLVHGYDEVDLTVVRRIVEHQLDDLLTFAAAIRAKLQ